MKSPSTSIFRQISKCCKCQRSFLNGEREKWTRRVEDVEAFKEVKCESQSANFLVEYESVTKNGVRVSLSECQRKEVREKEGEKGKREGKKRERERPCE